MNLFVNAALGLVKEMSVYLFQGNYITFFTYLQVFHP